MRILFVRHGESEANAKVLVGGPDSPLTEVGIEQARETAKHLKDQNVAQIVCSPFIRAQQTAEIIAGELGIPLKNIIVVNELHERRMGILEDKPKVHSTEFFYQNDSDHEFETHAQVISRVKNALDKIIEIASKSDGTTVVVGHATSGYFLRQVAVGKAKFEDFGKVEQIPNAGFVELTAG